MKENHEKSKGVLAVMGMLAAGLLVIAASDYLKERGSATGNRIPAVTEKAAEQDGTAERKEESDAVKQGGDSNTVYRDNAFWDVPYGYVQDAKHSGTIETFTYTTEDYTGSGKQYEKRAKVYLPYGYDPAKQYDVFYLLHGGGDDEEWYFGNGKYSTYMSCLLDNMIENGILPPCIVCTPTYQNKYCADEMSCIQYFHEELVRDLIPSLETQYATYYEEEKENSIEETRWHRAFGGFSMGAAATWWTFANALKEIGYFMPVSGNSWCSGEDDAGNSLSEIEYLEYAVRKQGMNADDFLLYSGCGGKGDLAYSNMKPQMTELRKNGTAFQYCRNFADGNFYWESWKNGGHDVRTVCQVVYNGLPKFFRVGREDYFIWAEDAMQTKTSQKLTKKIEDVIYGKWEKQSYYSRTAKRETPVNILLPPGYDAKQSYPVLYLLHGYWDNEEWMASDSVGLRQMLGNLNEQGKAEKMIVVCPYIYCSETQKECSAMDLENSLAYDNFIHDLTTDLMPFIEKTYSVKKGRENTAITGFSMGGRESLFIGFTHPELFSYLGAVCPAPGLYPGTDTAMHPGQMQTEEMLFPEEYKPYILYLSAAQEDPAVGNEPAKIHDILTENQVEHLWNELPDTGHDAGSVQSHLNGFLQTLFK